MVDRVDLSTFKFKFTYCVVLLGLSFSIQRFIAFL